MARQLHLDVLRIVSICAVVVIHVAVPYMAVSEVGSTAWQSGNVFDCLSRWSVPVFVMISGALFLDPARPQPLRKLWTKNIPRIVVILVFWNIVYALLYAPPTSLTREGLYPFAQALILGDIHMWFLYMIVGLYIVTPFLRVITASEKLTRYFLVLALVLNALVPFVLGVAHVGLVERGIDQLMIRIPVGYSFYFVLGYWLNKAPVDNRMFGIAVGLGLAGIVASFVLTTVASQAAGQLVEAYLDYLSLPVCLASAAVFLAGRRAVQPDSGEHPVLMQMSKASLGVYLIHVIVIRLLMTAQFGALFPHAALGILATAAASIALSFALSLLLNRIPFVSKHLM